MPPLAAIVAASLIGAADMDAPTLLGLMEAAQSTVQDVYLEYEGQMSFPTKGESDITDADGVFETYRGAAIERRDGAFLVDVYRRYVKRKDRPEVHRETLSILGDRFEAYGRTEESRRDWWPTEEARFGKLQNMGSIFKVMLRGEVLGRLRDGENYPITASGEEDVDGSPCLWVDFDIGKQGKRIERYYIDMDRGGIVLKYESHMDGNLSNRVAVQRVARYEDAKKQPVWIPMEAVAEAFGDISRRDARVFLKEATNRETFTVFPESVRVGTGFRDDRFTAKPRNPTLITNALKQAHRDFSQNAERAKAAPKPPPPPPLEEAVQLAAAEGDALLAPSRERSPNLWWSWAPWLVSLGSVAAIVAVTVHSRWGR